ncbi:regulation of nuclear pre-mRNA domain-containing protein 2a [Betta splendens]|uniref:Regulation of nuclear pre-mRNA domain-containing protein 2 n=1 Tax=Betta splendens TaxID=158456 RepID=A0A6P7NVD3_BETSP|nr:regulation of nuclear pre-mRNA domain-containing protein 2a [Betta splendens]
MAAGTRAASGGSLEATLERKFQNVTNTMDSIQGLSVWCIDNKKYHSLIVRHWMKCLKKSNASHRLNLFYLANDVIQNCKRKNAIVYRTAFAEVLPDAFLLVNHDGDRKVITSLERILSIWEERGVYSGTLISNLRTTLAKEESPPETPVEQKTPVESKADLRSKIVAEFVPQALIDQLSKYMKSVEEVEFREKQLTAMRVDICSSEALKKLKDKAGGKKFSRDFEEGSAQLQEFVKFLEKQSKVGPAALQALTNADIFYEMQYKEVKIVANAYQTFANRVSHLKRKLDSLKATLPDLDESPIPSPSADAPSPTGSESPFRGLDLTHPNLDLDGYAIDDEAEPPAPSPLSSVGGSPRPAETVGDNDNREVEDMELSEEEADNCGIIVEAQNKSATRQEESAQVPTAKESVAATQSLKQVTAPVAATAAAVPSVDLNRIGSILNNLSSAMKNAGAEVESPPAAAPTGSSVKTKPAASVASQDTGSLANLLSTVDMSPAELLGALSKVQNQSSFEGITSFLNSSTAVVSSDSSTTGKIPSSSSSTTVSAGPSQSSSGSSAPMPSSYSPALRQGSSAQAPLQKSNPASALVQALHRDMDLTTEPEPSISLESKIHSFLHGNPAFNTFDLGFPSNPVLVGDNFSPATGTDNQDGTPVRDEGGGTPTQDEIMDKPALVPLTSSTKQLSLGESGQTASFTQQSSTLQNPSNPPQQAHLQPGVAQNGQVYQSHPYGIQEMPEHGITAPVAHYRQISSQMGGPVPGERAPGGAMSERGWYSDIYPESSSQQPPGYAVTAPGGAGKNAAVGPYPYQTEQTQESQGLSSQQVTAPSSAFFRNNLPPVPNLPPPPRGFEAPPVSSSTMMPPEQPPMPCANAAEATGSRVDSVISGMVVHDHQHKSVFHQDDELFQFERTRPRHPESLHPHPEDFSYLQEREQYHNELHHHEAPFFQDNPYHHPDELYHRPGSPPHLYPRGRGRLTPPLSPSEDPYFSHAHNQYSPPPHPHYAPRRPPPPHMEMRPPGLRPPHRPPHPSHLPHPRGPPRAPFPRMYGPDPRLRGKRPGPPRGGGNVYPMFPPKRPFLPPRY